MKRVIAIPCFLAVAFEMLLTAKAAGLPLNWWLVTCPLWIVPAVVFALAVTLAVVFIGVGIVSVLCGYDGSDLKGSYAIETETRGEYDDTADQNIIDQAEEDQGGEVLRPS